MRLPLRRTLAFSFLETQLTAILGLVGSMVLARLLTPAEVGIYSLGAVVVAMGHALRDFGIGHYLMQAPSLTVGVLRAALGLQLAWSFTLAAIFVVASGPVSSFYGYNELRLVIILLAANFLLIPFSSIVMAWFRREFKYRACFLVTIMGATTNLLVSTTLAICGFGFMSLVYGSIANTLATVLTASVIRPTWFPWRPALKGWRQIVGFSTYSSAAGLVQEVGQATPDLFIGRVIGVAELAIYGKAVSTISMFSAIVMRAIWPISVPIFARTRHAGEDLIAPYRKAVAYVTVLAWPFLAFTAVVALPLIRLLFGPQWEASAEIVRILAIEGAIAACFNLVGSLLVACGLVRERFWWTFVSVAVLIVVMAVGVQFGLQAAAIAACLSALMTLMTSMVVLQRVVPINLRSFFLPIAPSLFVASVVGAVAYGTLALYGGSDASAWSVLPVFGACFVAWLASIMAISHPISKEISRLVRATWRTVKAPS